ncbi:MAG: glucan 1,4-alpha-glucosidase [Gemmatimonadota bacterium]
MNDTTSNPPGWPGITPHWTTSAKDGIGTAANRESRVWFSVSHGILDEVYHPFIDHATTRDFGLMVADGADFFSEEKRDTQHAIAPLEQGVAGYRITNTCLQGRYRITKTILTDPKRDVLLQKVKFEALRGQLSDYTLYALLAPHIGNQGMGNNGWAGEFRGIPMLMAQRNDVVLALACSAPWSARSCGYVGTSDGWQDVSAHKKMTWTHPRADDGNIALTGAIDLAACGGECVLALGFGRTESEAGQLARASLLSDFENVAKHYVAGWRAYQKQCRALSAKTKDGFDLYRVSTAVLKTSESKRFPGGTIASLSIPWGMAHGDGDLGGYHVVWPRDQVETAGAMLATDNSEAARRTLFFLMCTQDADGHWPQNMWLDGAPYWSGVQADETAFPILLADALRRRDALGGLVVWPMIRLAAQFLVSTGPVSPQDRWEENSGYSVFTLAAEIAALLAAADFADGAGETGVATFLRETADCWNSQIEDWTYVRDTELARRVGVEGYYIRIAPADLLAHDGPADCTVDIKNLDGGAQTFPAAEIVSVDALALVRFGLRAADDPRMLDTIKVIDATLKTETATGPVWHRYTHDGYGESADGGPFTGTGIGRGWPLLGGERAHYELAAGHRAEAERLLEVMGAQTSPGGMLPEQVWDGPDIPERELFNGHPSGSGMPLVWAHSEYLKLVRSLADDAVFDLPPQPVQRYLHDKTDSPLRVWRFDHRLRALPAGKSLRIEALAPASIRWSADGWATTHNTDTRDTGLGVHVAELPTGTLAAKTNVNFTFYWPQGGRWEEGDFSIQVVTPP